jgi:hypothetical protein
LEFLNSKNDWWNDDQEVGDETVVVVREGEESGDPLQAIVVVVGTLIGAVKEVGRIFLSGLLLFYIYSFYTCGLVSFCADYVKS